MRTRPVLIVFGLLVLVVGAAAFSQFSVAAREVRTGTALAGDLEERFVASGEVTVRRSSLTAPDQAMVREVHVKENDAVKSGQLLVELDASAIRSRFYAARGAFEAARSKLLEANRWRNLRAARLALQVEEAQGRARERTAHLADLELQLLDERIHAAQVELRIKTSELKDNEASLHLSELRAPFDGIVSQQFVQAGERVAAGQPVLSLVASTPPWVEAWVDAQDATSVSLGQAVTVRIAGLPGRMRGKVKWVAPALETPPNAPGNARFLHIRVELEDKNDRLRAGMTVDVEGSAVLARNTVVLPRAALQQDPAGACVYVVQRGRTVRVPVKLGAVTATQVQELEGPPAGAVVVLDGERLAEGERVRVVP